MRRRQGRRVFDIFVAPEYFFAHGDQEHFITSAEKDRVCELLRKLSLRHPAFLIIPGTVAWKQKAIRSNVITQLVCTDRGLRAQTRRDARVGTFSDRQKQAFTSARQSGDQYWLAQNSIYGYHGGERVLKYHKRNDGGEVNANDGARVFWVPGDRESYFSLQGLEFGVQICAEHGSKLSRAVHVQIVIASSHPLLPGNSNLHQGGCMMHADAMLEPAVLQDVGGVMQRLGTAGTATASPLSAAEIQRRTAAAAQYLPAKADASKGITATAAAAQRQQVEASRLGGRMYYFAFPLST